MQAKKNAPGESGIGAAPTGTGIENLDGKLCPSKRGERQRETAGVRIRGHPGKHRSPGAPLGRDPGANSSAPTATAGNGTSRSGAHALGAEIRFPAGDRANPLHAIDDSAP